LIVTALAVDEDLAAIALDRARQHLHQHRLARAVVAQNAHDLARVEVDGDVVDGLDAAEGLLHVAQFDKRSAGSRSITSFTFQRLR
jgi:hypothetical protein